MSQAKAITKYVRISPYKARRSADLIRNMCVEDVLFQDDNDDDINDINIEEI